MSTPPGNGSLATPRPRHTNAPGIVLPCPALWWLHFPSSRPRPCHKQGTPTALAPAARQHQVKGTGSHSRLESPEPPRTSHVQWLWAPRTPGTPQKQIQPHWPDTPALKSSQQRGQSSENVQEAATPHGRAAAAGWTAPPPPAHHPKKFRSQMTWHCFR